MTKRPTLILALVLALGIPAAICAQQAVPPPDLPGAGLHAGLTLGSDLLPNPSTGVMESWAKLGFTPDFSIGKFGIGLDLTLRFKLYPDASTPLQVYEPDWIPSGGRTLLDLYLPKLMYVRYGRRGIDPFYLKLGSITDFTLGSGFIIGDYANTRFLPALRLFGMQGGLDGALFKFPLLGFEMLTGNLANLDVAGARVFVRPFAPLGIPVLKSLQVGVTGVVDTDPYRYGAPAADPYPASELLYEYGADVTIPLVSSPILSATFATDAAFMMSGAAGFSSGIGGRILGFITYGAYARLMQSGFVPTYFDANYDLYRAPRFQSMMESVPGDYIKAWMANLGFSVFKDRLALKVQVEGPFSPAPDPSTSNQSDYPHLKGAFTLAEGILGGVSLQGSYEKYFLGRSKALFDDLLDPEDAIISLGIGYRVGIAVVDFRYVYSWNPLISDFEVSSSLSASIRF